jgi:putative spermidine/putrescine transport system substrate-binding protein
LLALSQLTQGCRRGDPALTVRFLTNSIPAQLLQQFESRLNSSHTLRFLPVGQLADLYELLQTWRDSDSLSNRGGWLSIPLPIGNSQPPPPADLVTIGDAWLTAAIQRELIQPLEIEELSGWQALSEMWQRFVQRDRQGRIDPQGPIWAAPYRFASLVIAYRVDEFESVDSVPTDWPDLWREDLHRSISLPDNPRIVIGLALKRLGQSFNPESISEMQALETELASLHQQVKIYSSSAYLQPLMLGDTKLAIGWSTDILPIVRRDRRLAAVMPASGTLLTADVWVRPASTSKSVVENNVDTDLTLTSQPLPASLSNLRESMITSWIDFCWQLDAATQLSLLSPGVSPALTTVTRNELPGLLRNDFLQLPEPEILQNSEFLMPLAEDILAQYRQAWITMRQV